MASDISVVIYTLKDNPTMNLFNLKFDPPPPFRTRTDVSSYKVSHISYQMHSKNSHIYFH